MSLWCGFPALLYLASLTAHVYVQKRTIVKIEVIGNDNAHRIYKDEKCYHRIAVVAFTVRSSKSKLAADCPSRDIFIPESLVQKIIISAYIFCNDRASTGDTTIICSTIIATMTYFETGSGSDKLTII